MEYQVTHIIPDGSDPRHRIDAIYGPLCGLIYEDDAIRQMEWRLKSFFTLAYNFYRAEVHIVEPSFGPKFLSTSPDGVGANNLCELPHWR